MPIKKSAIKSLLQDKKRHARNLETAQAIKKAIKAARRLIIEKKRDQAKEAVKKAVKVIDKAVQNKRLKKNTAARKKSRLIKTLNSIKD